LILLVFVLGKILLEYFYKEMRLHQWSKENKWKSPIAI